MITYDVIGYFEPLDVLFVTFPYFIAWVIMLLLWQMFVPISHLSLSSESILDESTRCVQIEDYYFQTTLLLPL